MFVYLVYFVVGGEYCVVGVVVFEVEIVCFVIGYFEYGVVEVVL